MNLKLKDTLAKVLMALNTDRYINESKSSSSISVAANTTATVTIDIAKSGYTPIGIVGIYAADTDVLAIHEFFLGTATTATVILRNTYSAARTTSIRVAILYRKNGY